MTPQTPQNKTMRLRGKHLLEMSGYDNTHRLALQSRISASTVTRYVVTPEIVKAFDLSILLRLLMEGCNLSKEQVLDLKLGEVFEILE